ncbi:hypothetical protein [Streptomyces shenzhenensis]|uniref:hypothetical protein n=1 Tax=Streptomyces shenzhenensis TaxID=943815 RepID=UPI0036A8E3AE
MSRTWWPQIAAAMCGGSPVRIASVMNSLRKSCGVNVSGWLLTSASAAVLSARIRQVRTKLRVRAWCSVPWGRWEQERHGRAPDLLEDVVGRHERQGCLSGANPEDDGGEDLAEFRGDQEEAFTVGFRRGDLEHGHDFAGGWQGVGDEAVVGEFKQFLDADAGMAEHFDDGPGPERDVFLVGEVAPLARGQVTDEDPAGLACTVAHELRSVRPELRVGGHVLGQAQALLGGFVVALDGPHQGGQRRQLGPGALIHCGFAT